MDRCTFSVVPMPESIDWKYFIMQTAHSLRNGYHSIKYIDRDEGIYIIPTEIKQTGEFEDIFGFNAKLDTCFF